MRRRDFISLVVAAAAWPRSVSAQQAERLPTIGFLGTSASSNMSRWTDAFAQRRRDLGWIEDRTVAIEYRWAQAHPERYAEIAAEFVRLKVDVIVTTVPAGPQRNRRPRSSPSSLSWRATLSGLAWSEVWRGRAATSLDYRLKQPTSPASASNFCAKLSFISASSRFWAMSITPKSCWRCAKLRVRRESSAFE
jgi:hypothetical protein